MAFSSYKKLHPVDQILTQLAIEAIPSDSQLIADKVMEVIPVQERSGTVLVDSTRNYMGFADVSDKRAPGSDRAIISNFDQSSFNFKCEISSFEDVISLEDVSSSQYPRSLEERSAKKVGRALKLAKERACANVLFNPASFGANTSTLAAFGNGSLGTSWSSNASDGLKDLSALFDVLKKQASGIRPDTLVLGYDAIRQLGRTPAVRSIFWETSGAAVGERIMNEDQVISVLKSVLRIPNIYVGEARYETSSAGVASSEADIWTGSSVFMGILRGSDAVSNANSVKLMPTFAVEFNYQGIESGTYDAPNRLRRHIYADQCYTHKVINEAYGFLLTDCI